MGNVKSKKQNRAGTSSQGAREVSIVSNSGNVGNVAQTQNIYGSQINNLYQGPLPCSDADDVNRKKLDEIRNGLKEAYSNLTMTGLPWLEIAPSLEDYYVDLEMTTDYGDGKSKPIHLENIFAGHTDEGDSNKLFLIEASPGYGKTTLCLKLLYDWGRGKEYIKHFDLALSISLRNYKDNLHQELVSALDLGEIDNTELSLIQNLLHDTRFRVLLLLDGFDELPLELEDKLSPLFKKTLYGHFHVIVTSRPGKVFSGKKIPFSRRAGMEKNVDLKKLFGKFVHVTGVSNENIDAFLHRALREQYTSILDSVLKSVDGEILQCPLFLLMLAVIYSEAPETATIKTKTGLYKEIHNFIVRRYRSKLAKGSYEGIQELTLFEEKNQFSELFLQLGELALQALKKDKLSFSESTLLDKCGRNTVLTEIGIFSRNCSRKTEFSQPEVTYEPIHKTMLEFWAAYNLWQTFKKSKQLFSESITLFYGDECQMDNSSLMFPFLAGLLQTEVNYLFSALQPFACAIGFDCFEELMPSLLNECILDRVGFTMLSKFLPFLVTKDVLDVLDPETRKTVMQVARSSNKNIVHFCDTESLDELMTLDVKLDTLILRLGEVIPKDSIFVCEKASVSCESLFCVFEDEFTCTHLELQNMKLVINQIRFDKISLDLRHVSSAEMLSFIFKDIITKDIKLKNVSLLLEGIGFSVTEYLGYITDILNMNVIQELHFEITSYDDEMEHESESISLSQLQRALQFEVSFRQFLNAAAKSEYLRKLHLVGYNDESRTSESYNFDTYWETVAYCVDDYNFNNLILDIGELCNNGLKSWDWIVFERIHLTCSSKAVGTNFKIGYFENIHGTCTDEAITFLQAAENIGLTIHPFLQFSGKWFEIHATFHVSLIMHNCIGNSDFGIYKQQLQKTTYLKLVFVYDEINTMPFQFKSFFIDVLPKLEVLELKNMEKNVELARNIIEEVVEYLYKCRNSKLEIVFVTAVAFYSLEVNFSIFEPFKDLLKLGFLCSFKIMFYFDELGGLDDKKRPWELLNTVFRTVEGFEYEVTCRRCDKYAVELCKSSFSSAIFGCTFLKVTFKN